MTRVISLTKGPREKFIYKSYAISARTLLLEKGTNGEVLGGDTLKDLKGNRRDLVTGCS
jgi:hypothetical protein